MSVLDLLNPDPPLSHRFGVFFFAGGVIPNPIDIRFQKVSGLSAEVNTTEINEGGQNLYTHRIPSKVNYNNLVLQRGMVIGSPLNIEFNVALSLFKFAPSNVMVTLFNDKSIPLAGWFFTKAYPVKWSVSDFDADANAVVIDTMELAYTRFQIIRV
jgi:phage tail-like protein